MLPVSYVSKGNVQWMSSGNDSCWCGTWSVLKKFRILTKVGFEYQHSLSHHLLNLRKRFVVSKTDQTNGLSTTIIISGAYFERCPGMPTPSQILKLPENDVFYDGLDEAMIQESRIFGRSYT